MKLYLFSIVLIAMAGSAMSQSMYTEVRNMVKQDVIHPMQVLSHKIAEQIYNMLECVSSVIGKTKRDVLSIPGLGSYLQLDGSEEALKEVIEKGAKFLISKRQLPGEAITGIVEFLRSMEDVKGVTLNIQMDKKSN